MRNFLIALPLLLAMFALTQPVYAADDKEATQISYEKGVEIKLADLEDENFIIKNEKFLMNNCSLSEGKEYQSKRTVSIKFTSSIKNRTAGYEQFSIIIVGLDEKKMPLWRLSSETQVQGKGLGILQGDCSLLPRGTLKGTSSLWIRLVEWDESNED